MKLLALLFPMLMSANAFAAVDICKDFFQCGSFVEKGTDNGKSYVTTVTIASTGALTANFKFMTSIDGGKESGWNLDVVFEENGSFKMYEGTQNYANGICSLGICTYGQHPWVQKGETEAVGNAGMLRFHANQLEYILIYGTPTKFEPTLQVFEKQ